MKHKIDKTQYGYFNDKDHKYVINNPLTPNTWINYIGNRKLTAFISQNAGGLMWYCDPQTRRISRYQYTATPPDQPGFYVYIKDKITGQIWNPHFAPTYNELDFFECHVSPGVTQFIAIKDHIKVELSYIIPPNDNVMIWNIKVNNIGKQKADLLVTSYLEYGLLEYMREFIAWCYLKNHFSLKYDKESNSIRYYYHVLGAPFTPCMAFGCTTQISGYECSRDAFLGRNGALGSPYSLSNKDQLSNSELPLGGHACNVIGVDLKLEPQESKEFAYIFALAETWDAVDSLLVKYTSKNALIQAFKSVNDFWSQRSEVIKINTSDPAVDRFVNIWNPYNAAINLELARSISTDHPGFDGLRYRDTTQDALAVANYDPDFTKQRMRQIFATQTKNGAGCFAFYPHECHDLAFYPFSTPVREKPDRCDNTVWQIYTTSMCS